MDRLNAQEEKISADNGRLVQNLASNLFDSWAPEKRVTITKAWDDFQTKGEITQKQARHDLLESLKTLFNKDPKLLESLNTERMAETGSIATLDPKIRELLQSLGLNQREIEHAYFGVLNDHYVFLTRQKIDFESSNYFKNDNHEQVVGTSFLESCHQLLDLMIAKTTEEIESFNSREQLILDTYPNKSIYELRSLPIYEIWKEYAVEPEIMNFGDLGELEKNPAGRTRFRNVLLKKKASLDQKLKKQKQLKNSLINHRLEVSKFLSEQALYELEEIRLQKSDLNKPQDRAVVAGILAFYNPGNIGPPGILNIILDTEVKISFESTLYKYKKDPDFKEFFKKLSDFEKGFRSHCLPPTYFGGF